MSENDDAENFARALEDLLGGRDREPRTSVPEMEVARRLLAADFSAESRVRAGLRARLLSKRSGPRLAAAFLSFAFAAACLLVVVVPRAAKRSRKARPESLAAGGYARGKEGLPVLPGRFASGAGAPGSPVFATARGREIPLKDGKAVVWEFEGAVLSLATRRTSPEEIFKNPKLRGVL